MGIYECLFQYKNKQGENCYYGCPKKKDYSVYFNDCHNCKYNCGLDDESEYDDLHTILCSKRAIDLDVENLNQIHQIIRNNEGRIIKLVYGSKDEEFYFPNIPNIATTLKDLWNDYHCKKMICFNLETGQNEKIYSYGIIEQTKNYDDPNWVMLWFVRK